MQRMFFGSTHVTLRATEVPIWLAAGLEVVPEEVDLAALNRVDIPSYDTPEVHSVLRQCEEKSTLPTEAWNATRRVRMRARRGKLSPAEIELFNSCFDVIYTATDLETAVNVKRWFKGEVLFRYFGQYDHLKHIRDMAAAYSRAELRDIICLPVFESLLELGVGEIFDRVAPLHGYVRPEDLGTTWQGIRESQPIIVVQSAVREDAHQTTEVRKLLPLSQDIPLTLLGKNVLHTVPADIKQRFEVTGPLKREDYIKRFFDARLLIHPFAHRYHNQYPNIEAIVGGLPVLFMTENPLYAEQKSAEVKACEPESLGAFRSTQDLCRYADEIYHQPKLLAELAERQRILLQPYSWKNVLAEAQNALRLVRRKSRSETPVISRNLPQSLVPGLAPFELANRFFEFNQRVPFYAFTLEQDWQFLAINAAGRPVIRLPANVRAQNTIIGAYEPIPKGKFELELTGRLHEGAALVAVMELYVDGNRPTAAVRVPAQVIDNEFSISVNLESFAPGVLAFRLDVTRAGYADIEEICLTRHSEDATKIELTSHNDVWSRFGDGKWVEADLLTSGCANTRAELDTFAGLSLCGDEKPLQVIVKRAGHLFSPEGNTFECRVEAKQKGKLRLWMATWNDRHVLAKTRHDVMLQPGSNVVSVATARAAADDKGITPVLYFKADANSDARLIAVRKAAGQFVRVYEPTPIALERVPAFRHSLRSKTSRQPLMLWGASHGTLSMEEIPLFLEAGFRVIPLLTDMWNLKHRPSLDSELCQDWKQTVDLPGEIVAKLQALQIYSNDPGFKFSDSDLKLMNEHLDVVYVTVMPDIAAKLAERFSGSVVFRPFGHGYLQTYSRIARAHGVSDLNKLRAADNFVWCPILGALQDPEEAALWKTPVLVSGFVSPERFGGARWDGKNSDAVVAETIPRINAQDHYRQIYEKFVGEYAQLPLRILGNNQLHGGELDDPRILGRMDDEEYFKSITSSRISIYHGDSPYHLHYHPLEYMALGVPVLFHETSALAMEARDQNKSEEELEALGMYRDAVAAGRLAQQALDDVEFAIALSERQRCFTSDIFSRQRALHQAQWLRTVCLSQINLMRRSSTAASAPNAEAQPVTDARPRQSKVA